WAGRAMLNTCSRGGLEPRRSSAMSNRSFIDRAAEERRKRLVVGGVIRFLGACLVGGLELIEDGVHRLVGRGGPSLPLHRVEIVHVGLIGLFIVAEQTHRKTLLV